MKQVIILTLIATSIIFTNCKKKSDDPAPAPAATDNTPGNSTFGNSSAFIYNGVKKPVTTRPNTYGSAYSIIGSAGSTEFMTAVFYNGKPTSSSTVDLATSTSFELVYTSPNLNLSSSQGKATITVNDTAIFVNFTDATFSDGLGADLKFSGQLIYVTKPSTGGGGTTTPATTSGTVTVGNNSPTNLTVQGISGLGMYSLMGYTASGTTTLTAGFYSGKPTASSTVNFAESATIALSYTSGSNTYTASSGTANVTVSGTAITVSFTNVVFSSGSSTITLSGNLYTSK
jgi:hypothetical protein